MHPVVHARRARRKAADRQLELETVGDDVVEADVEVGGRQRHHVDVVEDNHVEDPHAVVITRCVNAVCLRDNVRAVAR